MMPIETMAKAFINAGNDLHGKPNDAIWDALSDAGRAEVCDSMCAAILALRDADFPKEALSKLAMIGRDWTHCVVVLRAVVKAFKSPEQPA